jgi:organic hydroperoxide reductase OsmC/OhrA
MRFSGHVRNSGGGHLAEVAVGDRRTTIQIAAKASGRGSSVSGGELLMLAMATCYCNDVYREAAKLGIEVTDVDVECTAEFSAEGAAAGDMAYTARITAKATEEQIRGLAAKADALAEIQNSIRQAIPVTLRSVEAVSLKTGGRAS